MTAAPKPLAGRKILIVDDDDQVRLLLREDLESLGAAVVDASGGRTALSSLGDAFGKAAAFDAVITDIRMHDGDGLELVARIRATTPRTNASTTEIPIIILTAFADAAVRQAAARARALVVAKPYVFEDLLRRLLSLLARS